MYSETLAITGAIFLIYSMCISIKIIRNVEWRFMRKPWHILFCMMLAALIVYIIYLQEILVSPFLNAILFFWSVFALIATRASYQLVDGLKSSQANINVTKQAIESDQTEIETMKHELESKNEEMDKLLAEVYALRYNFEKNKSGKSAVENKRMSRILDELKKELDKNKKGSK